MKKILGTAVIIIACAMLGAAVWPKNDAGGKVPADAEITVVNADMPTVPAAENSIQTASSDDAPIILEARLNMPETVAITAEKEEDPAEPLPAEAVNPATQKTPAMPTEPMPAPQSAAPASADPYHPDVYPSNVYSEEFIYDKDGNLLGKTYTIPTEFGPDTIWIDGQAFYNVPDFGLIEWGGPGQRTEDYTMYESGVKVGIMGGEDEAPVSGTPTTQPELPKPTGEVIDQTINVRPEKNSTPPDYKPDTNPPDDSANIGCP